MLQITWSPVKRAKCTKYTCASRLSSKSTKP